MLEEVASSETIVIRGHGSLSVNVVRGWSKLFRGERVWDAVGLMNPAKRFWDNVRTNHCGITLCSESIVRWHGDEDNILNLRLTVGLKSARQTALRKGQGAFEKTHGNCMQSMEHLSSASVFH